MIQGFDNLKETTNINHFELKHEEIILNCYSKKLNKILIVLTALVILPSTSSGILLPSIMYTCLYNLSKDVLMSSIHIHTSPYDTIHENASRMQ